MNHAHKISIITISYNQGKFLEETLLSVFDQNYPNLEYILIDGGSKDNSLDIIEKYRDQFAYVVSEPDKGPSDGLNKGFSKATGDIFFYLNSDDLLAPGALDFFNELYTKNKDYDIFYGHGFMELSSANAPTKVYKSYSDKWSAPLFMKEQIMMAQPSTFFKGTFFQKNLSFNLKNNTCWDGELMADAAIKGGKFLRFHKHVSIFRLYQGSISAELNDTHYQKFVTQQNAYFDRMKKAGVKELNLPNIGYKILKFLRDPVIMVKRLFSLNNKKIERWKSNNS